MSFIPTVMKKEIEIDSIVTIHYFEFSKNYKFIGEKHNFWEMVYVDKGNIIEQAGTKKIHLEMGDVIFHKPNEWHNMFADGNIAPNVGIITFECSSPAMSFFENRIIKAEGKQKSLISKIIEEEIKCFKTPLDEINTTTFERRDEQPFAGEQLIELYLTELLISFIRAEVKFKNNVFLPEAENKTFNSIVEFMKENLDKKLKLDDIVANSLHSKSSIKKLFQKNAGMGAIEFFIKLKIQQAKKYLREDNYNITQISVELGYDNIHYFSRQFKQQTGMTPSEYIKSVKSLNELL